MMVSSCALRRTVAAAALVAGSFISASAFAQTCEVKIGAIGPMSGGAAVYGFALKAGTEFIAAKVNDEGGLPMGDKKCTVKVVSFDAQYTAAGGAAAANYMISEGVSAVTGPLGTPEYLGFRPIAKRANIVAFNPSYTPEAISPEYPLVFHSAQAPQTFAPAILKAAVERFKHKSVVLLGPNDQGGTDGAKALEKIYAAQNFKTYEEYYQRGTTNFAPLVARIMSFNVDAIEVSTVPPVDQTIIFKQLAEAGWKGIVGSMGGGGEKPIAEGTDNGKTVKGAYWVEVMNIEQPGAVKLKEDFRRLMKTEPPVNAHLLVQANATEMILAAISKAGTDKDGEKIGAALRSMQPESRYFGKEGWRGKTQYGINQELAYPVGMGIYADGKRVGVQGVPIASE